MDKNVKRKAGGFGKPSALSPQLQELVGEPELARTEVCDTTLRNYISIHCFDMTITFSVL